jgi:hypothetical protein
VMKISSQQLQNNWCQWLEPTTQHKILNLGCFIVYIWTFLSHSLSFFVCLLLFFLLFFILILFFIIVLV